jgi:predicted Fe-S protein YdhL (DUF1289 family)
MDEICTEDVLTDTGMATPCTRVCVLHPRLGLCIGCGRSRDEIAAWIAFTDRQRAGVMAELPLRLARMRAADARRPTA